MEQNQIDMLAKKIWDYHHINQPLEKADCIIVLGSYDTRTAERGAELFLQGIAPLLIFSGGRGRLTPQNWKRTEAEKFAEIALQMGVPKEKIMIENKSTNTGENILFTKKLLEEASMRPQKIIAVQKPYMERRVYASFKKIWPELEVMVTSPQISFEDYPTTDIPKEEIINDVVGDLCRIKLYPEKGYSIPQDIPTDIWQAYEQLISAGFTKYLLTNP